LLFPEILSLIKEKTIKKTAILIILSFFVMAGHTFSPGLNPVDAIGPGGSPALR